MSVVTVQLGQAGNQVGCEFFGSLASHARDPDDVAAFFRRVTPKAKTAAERLPAPTLEARAVLVDLEEKVIASTLHKAQRSGSWRYPKGQHYCQRRGAGNNWANGYMTCGDEESDAVLQLVMKEVEKCDDLVGFLILMSVAGGTGSGFGTRVTERLREQFPKSFLINQIVWPFATGEVIVQNYNTVLSLSHLYQVSDAVILLQNDELHNICSRMLHLKTVGFEHINKVIADHMAGAFQRSFHCPDQTVASMGSIPFKFGDLVERLCPHPDFKLLSLRAVPQMPDAHREYTLYQWPGTLRTLRQMLIANSPCEEGINWRVKAPEAGSSRQGQYNLSLANLLVVRGTDVKQVDVSAFADEALYASWNPEPFTLCASATPRAHEKSVALITNCQAVAAPMDSVVDKAWNMFASKAYVHQYERHGITQDDFIDSFAVSEQIIAAYRSL